MMEKQRSSMIIKFLTTTTPLLFITFYFLCLSGSVVEGYKNYTVGDSLGWYDNTQNPSIDYQQWVSGKDFTLGDFLIFNTDSNHSVVQTYNLTTYKSCDSDDSDEDDTVLWSAADPSATTPVPVSVALPLVKEGLNYFFSGDYDGDQCNHGQHFEVNVKHGQGLPPSLKSPSDQSSSPGPASSRSGDDDSTPNPDTVISSNFDHPKESDSDGESASSDGESGSSDGVKEKSGSGPGSLRFFDMRFIGVLLLVLSSFLI